MKQRIKYYKLALTFALLFIIIYDPNLAAQSSSLSHIENKKSFRIPWSFSYHIPQFLSGPVASPDGRHVMCVIRKNNKDRLNVDGVDQLEFDEINFFTFSPDGKRTACIGKKDKQFFLVVDGKIEKTIDSHSPSAAWGLMTTTEMINFVTGQVKFTPDSKKVYYRDKKGWHIDDSIYQYSLAPTFSPDGTRFAFCNGAFEKNFVFIDGIEKLVNGVVMGSQLFFSPDSKHFAYMVIRPEGVFLNMDGTETRVIGNIQPDGYPQRKFKKDKFTLYDFSYLDKPLLTFSPDSKRFAYWGNVEKGKGIVVVEDGKVSPVYQSIGTLTYSRDGNHFVYAALKDKQLWTVLDGNNHILLNKLANASLNISDDGKRIGYSGEVSSRITVGNLEYYVGVDSAINPNQYEFTSVPEFSPDGSHVVYATIEKIGTYARPGLIKNVSLVIDGSSKAIDGIFIMTLDNKTVFFDSNEKFHYFIFKKINKDELEIIMIEEAFNTDK